MPWIKFPTWDRWGELTRFRVAVEAAIAAEHGRWETLPIENPAAVTIADPVAGGDFRCSLQAYKTALTDTHQLYSMLLGAYAGLIEEHGRSRIEYALSVKQIPRTAFPSINLTDPLTKPLKTMSDQIVSKAGANATSISRAGVGTMWEVGSAVLSRLSLSVISLRMVSDRSTQKRSTEWRMREAIRQSGRSVKTWSSIVPRSMIVCKIFGPSGA